MIDELKKASNLRVELQDRIQQEIQRLYLDRKIDSIQLATLSKTLEKLTDHMGKAERINNTVFPTQYSSYTHKGILIFSFMLPYGMLYSTGPFVILICVLVSFFFSMLESIATHLQDPFQNRAADIPMNALSRTIERDIKQMIGEKDIPAPVKVDEHGILM